MVLSNAIIFISVFVGKQRRSDGCRLLLNLKVYCLVLVEVHGRRALLQTRRFLTFSVESCLDALNIILFFFFFFFLSLHKSWNQKICFVTLMYCSHIYD